MDLPERPGAAHRAILFIPYPPPTARAVHGALAPETDAQVPKTSSGILLEPEGVRILLAADDLPSLRAAVNSHLRWVDAAQRAARLATS